MVPVGETFNRLSFIKMADKTNALTLCSCGNKHIARLAHLKSGAIKSCGCLNRELSSERRTTHSLSNTAEYSVWSRIRQCTSNPNNHKYHRYGGRGITVCDRWLESFESFYEDMGPRPSKKHSIERINNDGNYEPSNCKWATRIEQANNKSNNRILTYKGNDYTLAALARKSGISRETIRDRLDTGWPIEKAVETPIPESSTYEFNGKQMKIAEISKLTGIKHNTLTYRLRNRCMSVEEAVT